MPSERQLFTPNQSPCCPVTGLPITTRPEWTEIQFKPDYSATFSIIGKAILLITPKGYPSEEGTNALLKKRAEVIREAGLSDRKYVEIRDYSMLSGAAPKGSRMAITNFVLKEGSEGYLQGFWVFGPPLLIRLMFQAGLKLLKIPIPVGVAKDYAEAIRDALKILRQNGVDMGLKPYPSLKKDGWALELEGYGISFELIGDDILYTIAHGRLKESDVEQFISLNEKVIHEAGLAQKGYFYRIINWERFESSTWKARRMYIEGLKEITKKTPCKLIVAFGLNTFMKTLVGVSSPFVSSPVMVARDLQDAIEITEREREREISAGSSSRKRQKTGAKIYTEEQLTGFANEMLQVVGGINWDQAGISLDSISEEHPLKPVLEALTIVKLDLDNLLQEKENSQKFLQESEGKYRALFENADDAIFLMDRDVFIDCNKKTHEMFGCTREQIIGQPPFLFSPPVQPDGRYSEEKALEKINMALSGREQFFEWKHIMYDGTPFDAEVSLNVIRLENKDFLQAIVRDVSDRKKAEELLGKSEERYRTMVENASDMVYRTDENGYFTFVNPAVLRITGYEKEEIIGKHYQLLVRPDMFKEAITFFANQLINKIQNTYYEYPIITKKGHERWIGQNLQLIMEEDHVTGFQAVARDITDRRRAEGKLFESEEKYRNILESIEDGYFEVDLAGNFTFFNPSMRAILGYPREEIQGMNNRVFMDPENAKKVFRAFNEIYVTGIPSKGFEWEVIQKDGARKHIEVSASLMTSPGEKPTGFRGIARDVTERKMIEATEQAKLRAEAASKAKSQFLANMSHEIRTPLHGILGMAEVCLETALDEEQKHLVSTINKEADSLLEIINEILDFSKIEAGKLEIEHIPFDLRNLFEDVTESFSYRAIQEGLELISFISPETPTRIVGDPGRLRQVLRNLIGNAIKFTHEGRIVVKAEPAQELGDNFKLRFLVTDTGIGIPKEKQAIVFESFTQADGSTTRQYGGTGLGITISKQLAELMGGEMGVDSEEGKGSTFWFTSFFSKQSETDQQRRKEVPLSNVTVLVVDDNNASRQLIAKYIGSWGSVPVEAASAKEALSILKGSIAGGEQINLVLSDLNMPEMSGFELAHEIRCVESFRSIPIIIITGYGNPGDGKTCRDIGIEGYLTKPLRESELRSAIELVLWSSMNGESRREIDLVTRHTSTEGDRKDIRILLAEDYPTNQEIAKRHLDRAGYQVDLAEDGKQAFEAFKRKHYDLILMDVQMPVMDGYQATKAIREIESELAALENINGTETMRRVPIIAMTAHATKEHQELCLEVGMDDFLSKPITRKVLLSTVEKWLTSRSIPSSLSESAALNTPSKTGQDISPMEVHPHKPIDLERAIDEFEGDKELLAEVIAGFTEKVIAQIGTIREALSCGDADTVKREAHAIKGGASSLTAEDLSKVACELESKGKSNELDGAGEIVDSLEREFEALTRYIQANFNK